MDSSRLQRVDECAWRIEPFGAMRVPVVIYATEELIASMDDKVFVQATNVAMLPGIQAASYAMPDAHWGYGFPIGGVAAFDPAEGGVISAGGVGYDISCGVRCLLTGLTADHIRARAADLAEILYRTIPAGIGSTGRLRLNKPEMDAMLGGGARWATERGYGRSEDLERIEEGGSMAGARPACVSDRARDRMRDEVGTLGSGNHYLEVQEVEGIHDPAIAEAWNLRVGDAVISIHCGSRGLGHQIGTEFLLRMAKAAPGQGIDLPDRELACATIESPLGQEYLGAMRSAMNCAMANRQVLTHLAREAFAAVFPAADLRLLYDVSHNTCKVEEHVLGGRRRRLFVHRKGATRAFGPGHPALPPAFRATGQPVLIGGSMGTASWVLAGTATGMERSFGSACHGAGRSMSRNEATRTWRGQKVVEELRQQGILIRSPSMRGVAEEAPLAYKNVDDVVEATARAGLAAKVVRLRPLVCVKG